MPDISSPFTIIYIVGLDHSGSTLLDLLIGSHSSAIGLWEIHYLSVREKIINETVKRKKTIIGSKCTCGAKSYMKCTFWKKVNRTMMDKYGLSLWEVDLYNKDPEIFKLHNYSLFESVSHISGCKYIVDSSKDLSRLIMLQNTGIFDIRPLYLVRSVHGICYYNIKKGRNYLSTALNVERKYAQIRLHLSDLDYLDIVYDQLVNNPDRILKNIMNWIGLTFEEDQLNWTDHEHHNIGGNRMRRVKNNRINPDYIWRENLSIIQKIFITCISIFGQYYFILKYKLILHIKRIIKRTKK